MTPLRGKVPVRKGWQSEPPLGLQELRAAVQSGHNLGLRCGAVSGGIVVLDVDPAKGGSIPSGLPPTVVAETGGGGWHFFFTFDGELPGGNSQSLYAPGIDFKTDRGQVVLAGSTHPDTGAPYRWRDGCAPWECAIAPLPAFVLERLRQGNDVENSASHAGGVGAKQTNLSASYARAALESEAVKVTNAPPGTRNGQLFKSSAALHELAAGGVLDESEIEPALLAAAAANGVLAEDGERVTRRTIESGRSAGSRKPRSVPARDVGTHASGKERTPTSVDADKVLLRAVQSDLGNAERLIARHGAEIRYCLGLGWFVWDGTIWKQDPGPFVRGLAAKTARRTLRLAAKIESEERRKALVKWCVKSESASGTRAAVAQAETFSRLHVAAEALDANPWLLNTPGQVINLKTGETFPNDPRFLLTKITGGALRSGAECPRWLRFLDEVFEKDRETIAFVQRLGGYLLNGSIREQVFVVCWGRGANGKSVLLQTLQHVLGTYAVSVPMSLWLSHKDGEPANRNTPDLMRLQGARLALSAESDAGRRLDEAKLKKMTGSEQVEACAKYRDPVTFPMQATIVMASNHRPRVTGNDEALWRRVVLLPFNRVFAPHERDKQLEEKLHAEADGILAWLVEGAATYLREGLNPPRLVEEAVAAYREESDTLSQWLADRCEQGPEFSEGGDALLASFNAWSEERHGAPVAAHVFWRVLTDRGFEAEKGRGGRTRTGLRLLSPPAQRTADSA